MVAIEIAVDIEDYTAAMVICNPVIGVDRVATENGWIPVTSTEMNMIGIWGVEAVYHSVPCVCKIIL
ncbi:MAG: hypothetical protein C4294_19545 [Nitrospiraceae bacterium]